MINNNIDDYSGIFQKFFVLLDGIDNNDQVNNLIAALQNTFSFQRNNETKESENNDSYRGILSAIGPFRQIYKYSEVIDGFDSLPWNAEIFDPDIFLATKIEALTPDIPRQKAVNAYHGVWDVIFPYG